MGTKSEQVTEQVRASQSKSEQVSASQRKSEQVKHCMDLGHLSALAILAMLGAVNSPAVAFSSRPALSSKGLCLWINIRCAS
jgi:hypothetical protein